MDFSAVNGIRDVYEAGELHRALTQRVKALRMVEFGKRIASGELALGKSIGSHSFERGRIVGYRGLKVLVELPDGGRIVSIDADRVYG